MAETVARTGTPFWPTTMPDAFLRRVMAQRDREQGIDAESRHGDDYRLDILDTFTAPIHCRRCGKRIRARDTGFGAPPVTCTRCKKQRTRRARQI